MSLALLVLFAVWFVLAVINQFKPRRLKRALGRYDLFELLPSWGFFTADIRTADVYLFMRDRSVSGDTSDWKEISTGKRNGVIKLVYPERRIRAAFSRIRRRLVRQLAQRNGNASDIKESLSYQLVLHYVMSQGRDPSIEKRQFLIATKAEADSPEPVRPLILSAFHEFRNA